MFFKKPPLLKGGGFGFAKTGGILLKLPAESDWMGFSPHPSKPLVLPPSPKGRLYLSCPSLL